MKKLFLIISLLFTAVCALTGCGEQKDSNAVALSIVIGTHANAPDIPLNSEEIEEAIYNCCYTQGEISMITVDGDPQVYYQTSIPEPSASGLTESKLKTLAEGYTQQLLAEVSAASPTETEVDTLKAIEQASNALNSCDDGSDKFLLIMDSGLSTSGYLNFTQGILEAETEDIVNALIEAEAIPDLSGVSVKWMFLGQTASPQEELSESQKNKLKEIWEAVLTEAGATNITFTNDIASGESQTEYPAVSSVEAGERGITVSVNEVDGQNIMETVVLNESSVQFVGDSAEFIDEQAAYGTIQLIAEQMLAYPEINAYVVGTTASLNNREYCLQLSEDRANAVANVLISMGVSGDRLTSIGLGFEDPWHISDLDENGIQVETYASQNRKVLIIDTNSEDALLI